ncbi:MAG: hypothetical protein M5U09_03515 [Gammaproteobacteria bacterium]|nr:hypothetical protein [Gammaproteobacteria bacterium]
MKVKTIAVALFVSTLALPVLAQTGSTPRIDQRQSNQQQKNRPGRAVGFAD